MRENLDQWDYVLACYAVGIAATIITVVWAWIAMQRAEQGYDEVKRK